MISTESAVSQHLLKDLMPWEQVVQHTTIENLDVITAGQEVDNPAELLSSPRLKELLDEFRQSYEVIIIDSPACAGRDGPGDCRRRGRWNRRRRPCLDAADIMTRREPGSSSTTWEPPCSG